MDNKQFPEQPEFLPQDFSDIPEEETTLEEEFFSSQPDVPVEEPPVDISFDAADSEPATEPVSRGSSFMERIPDVGEEEPTEESISQDTAQDMLTDPAMGEEITPDEGAMNYHGMLGHDEEEPPFDMSILDDPDLAEAEEPEAAPDSADQEYRDNGQEFDEMFNAPPEEPAAPVRPVRKGRPKRKKGEGLLGIPNILVTCVWLALILAIGVTAGRMMDLRFGSSGLRAGGSGGDSDHLRIGHHGRHCKQTLRQRPDSLQESV